MKKREIKFRAWDEKKREMKLAFDLSKNPKYWWESNKDYPLMQFTFLLDKNGKEIYEGDILSEKWKVEVYQNDEGTFMVKFHNSKEGNNMSLKQYLQRRKKAGCEEIDCVIIGNVFENPEFCNK